MGAAGRGCPGLARVESWEVLAGNSGAALGQLSGARRHARRRPGRHRRRAGRGRAGVPRARATSAAAVRARRCGVPAACAQPARGTRRPHRPHRPVPELHRCTSAAVCRRQPHRARRDPSMPAATAASAPGRPPRAGTCTVHRGGAAMSAAMSPQVAARVSRTLHHEYAGVLAEPVSTACPRDTVTDPSPVDRPRSPPAAGRQAGRGAADRDGRGAPASGHGDPLAGRPIFGRRRTARPRRRPNRREQQ